MQSNHEDLDPIVGQPSQATDKPQRILARQLARPLTDEEIDLVAGGMMRRADTNCETGCTNDCGS